VNLLFIGDVVGKAGREAIGRLLPGLMSDFGTDLVIANGENAAGGFGITPPVAEELYSLGVHVLTMGNHVWRKREVMEIISTEPRLLRPANYPPGTPGRGAAVYDVPGAGPVGVVNACGRVFMDPMDCPFRAVERELEWLQDRTRTIIVDFHAEATSEKQAMGWFLDGRVSAVLGTHTHIQTADARVLPRGTAYLTDVGMAGPRDSILGLDPAIIIERFLTSRPVRFKFADGPAILGAAFVDVDTGTGRARTIRTLQPVIE
jgi:hypothetical protein